MLGLFFDKAKLWSRYRIIEAFRVENCLISAPVSCKPSFCTTAWAITPTSGIAQQHTAAESCLQHMKHLQLQPVPRGTALAVILPPWTAGCKGWSWLSVWRVGRNELSVGSCWGWLCLEILICPGCLWALWSLLKAALVDWERLGDRIEGEMGFQGTFLQLWGGQSSAFASFLLINCFLIVCHYFLFFPFLHHFFLTL